MILHISPESFIYRPDLFWIGKILFGRVKTLENRQLTDGNYVHFLIN